jgi:hypothetical protein
LFQRIVPLRELLIAGDLRPLYVAWLACAGDEAQEPPVPTGLKDLPPAVEALAEFYAVDGDLLAAAAERSQAATEPVDRQESVEMWLSRLKVEELRELAARLLGDDAAAGRAETLARMREETRAPTWPLTPPSRTMEDLRDRAEELREERLGREEQARQAARSKRLVAMAANPKQAIADIEALIANRSTADYEKAAQGLADLREALGPPHGPRETRAIAARIRRKNPRLNRLVAALRKHDLLD